MKIRNILIATILLLGVSQLTFSQVKDIRIVGETSADNNGLTIYILHEFQKAMHSDSVVISEGKFEYNGQVDGPTMVSMLLKHKDKPFNPFSIDVDKLNTYIDEGDLRIYFSKEIKDATITENEMSIAYLDYMNRFKDLDDSFNRKASSIKENTEENKTLVEEYLNSRSSILLDYLENNPSSYFSLLALSDLGARNFDVNSLEPLFNSLSEKIRSTPFGVSYIERLNRARPTAIGSIAPDFELQDIKGNKVKLSDFRGQYVLVDFWASWCAPCREENPFLVDLYDEFKDKGFTILGVSLDDEKGEKAWRDAVVKDKLTWTQVSDLKGWKSDVAQLYNISSVPTSFLLDKEGKIIAYKLRGKDLYNKINTITQ